MSVTSRGWYWAATTGAAVGFESWPERDQLLLMDFEPGVWESARSRSGG
ncbi:hypothetical protein [Streptomyces nanshensis]|nr:hypothetical protein [Streptomyces nanshensis]